jgi:phosphotransferase system enzyme I (PtsI)
MMPRRMPRAAEYSGRPAAPGLAAGPLVRLGHVASRRAPSGDVMHEARALHEAIEAAIGGLSDLAGSVGGHGAEMLAFQIAMLEDDELVTPALDAIAKGSGASEAWSAALDAQVADYEGADTDYFRARAADLKDIRDRVLRHLAGESEAAAPAGAVLTSDDLTPSRFLAVDWSRGGGIALAAGSPSSHVAMLARSRGVPMVVGLGTIDFDGHDTVIVDGDSGQIILSPAEKDWSAYNAGRAASEARAAREAAIVAKPAVTADGVPISVMINVGDPDELRSIDPAICDGVGLVRTEFLFHGEGGLPDEESQYRAYRHILEWAGARPVVIRTLDAGGDKPIAGLTIDDESNPFLGTRGIRLSLARPDIFRVQIRALLRAAVHGNAKVMLPMVTIPEEIDAAAALFAEELAALQAAGAPCRMPPLGIMVEVPAVAIEPAEFSRAAFFSIGSNDLTQYVTASARDIAAVAGLNNPAHPAVIRLIGAVVRAGHQLGREVSLCGDMGGDPAHVPALIAAGLRTVSVAPRLVGRTKLAIAAARATS